jgi:hypothetical protein
MFRLENMRSDRSTVLLKDRTGLWLRKRFTLRSAHGPMWPGFMMATTNLARTFEDDFVCVRLVTLAQFYFQAPAAAYEGSKQNTTFAIFHSVLAPG